MPMDRLGHDILRKRLRLSPKVLKTMLEGPVVAGFLKAGGRSHHFVITGIGASEAHARYLACLLNRFTSHRAEFRHLSSFCLHSGPGDRQHDLIVFSQDVSPNARIALQRAEQFRQTFLFTTATEEGALEAGENDKAAFLHSLKDNRIGLIHYPLENERTTLLRLVGPLAGYLAAAQFADSLAPGALPSLDDNELLDAVEGAENKIPSDLLERTVRQFKGGFHLVASAPLSEFGQNLSYKFHEGLFLPAPHLWDILQFAHGPFQETCAASRPVILLAGANSDSAERELFARARHMLDAAGNTPYWILDSHLPPVYRIFEYEMIFNHLILVLLDRTRIDQVNWPGKGLDRPIYNLADISAGRSE